MLFKLDEKCIINQNAIKGLPDNVGDCVTITRYMYNGSYDYEVKLPHGDYAFVKESELNKLTDKKLNLTNFFYRGNVVIFEPTEEEVMILKVDWIHNQVEVQFEDGSSCLTSFEKLCKKGSDSVGEERISYFEQKGQSLGKLVDSKQAAYGDSISKTSKLMKVYLEDYKVDGGYFITDELLDHILLQVRIVDKQNRIFSNPKADKMDESPYDDISGYGMLGGRMQNKQ